MENEISIIKTTESLLSGKLSWEESLEFMDQVLSSDTDWNIFETMLSVWHIYQSRDSVDNHIASTYFSHD